MDEGLIEKLEKAIEEGNQEVLQLLYDVAYAEVADFVKNEMLPAMIENLYAPAFGWSADFKTIPEYLSFIDSLMGKEGYGEEKLKKYIKKHISDYQSKEDLAEIKEWYGGGKGWFDYVVDEIIADFDLKDAIDILANDILKSVKTNEGIVYDWIDRYGNELLDNIYNMYEQLIKDRGFEELLNRIKQYGYIKELRDILNKG
jgi:hypothetical protein